MIANYWVRWRFLCYLLVIGVMVITALSGVAFTALMIWFSGKIGQPATDIHVADVVLRPPGLPDPVY